MQAFDAEYGGLGKAPKFPQPAILRQALARTFAATTEHPVYQAIDFSLQQMARGGIQDHVGGGFFRYSTDDRWMIPHFEKMLYDNGQLLQLFAQAWQLNENPLFAEAVASTSDWLRRDMTSPSGAFYAALDADSEGVEGKFYRWAPQQVSAILDTEAYPAFAWRYGLDQPANFEGQWHLHAYHDEQDVCKRFDISAETCREQQQTAQQLLLAQRELRVRPGLDQKILTSWNALVIRGLSSAARLWPQLEYADMALRCLQAIGDECWHEGRLLAQSRLSGKIIPGYLDDYALLMQALLDCLQLRWQTADLDFAIELADQLLEYFADHNHGGFYFTASDHEKLIQRPKSWQDEAMPSGNANAAQGLYRLGLLTGETRYTDAAEKVLQSFADKVNQNALHAASFVALLETIQRPPMQVILRGEASPLALWQERLLPRLQPSQSAYFIASDVSDLPTEIVAKTTSKSVSAWVCEGFSCRAPIDDVDSLLRLIDE